MFVFLVVLITISSTLGKKNTSCDFEDDMCGWSPAVNENCRWEINSNKYHGNAGYIYLNGTNKCSSSISWEFNGTDIPETNNLTIEYYVIGPGPFSLDVSHDNSTRSDWKCSIQPGKERRVTHISAPGTAEYLHIKGEVTSGSTIILTQIWNKLQGNASRSSCSLATQEEKSGTENGGREITSSTIQVTATTITAANSNVINTSEVSTNVPTTNKKTETPSVTYITTETETGTGRSSETETGNGRSSETETGTERSSETETGTGRSSETETGTGRSSETETGNGTSPVSTPSVVESTPGAERQEREKKKKKNKMILGIVFGVVGVNIVLVAAIIVIIRRRRKRRDNQLCDQPIQIGINSNVSYDNSGYGTLRSD